MAAGRERIEELQALYDKNAKEGCPEQLLQHYGKRIEEEKAAVIARTCLVLRQAVERKGKEIGGTDAEVTEPTTKRTDPCGSEPAPRAAG